jgi:DNA modification methylase
MGGEVPTGLEPLILQGNVLDVLRTLPRGSVHCVVTSPPFQCWGLRRYDVCGCAQDYVREEGVEHPLPRKADSHVRGKKPDPNCRWCHGTGLVPGMETLWGGVPEHKHQWVDTQPRWQRKAIDVVNPDSISAGNVGSAYDARGGKQCGCGASGDDPTSGLPEHEHHWVKVLTTSGNGSTRAVMKGGTLNPQSATRAPRVSTVCGCGAWFGGLGLEPTPQMYVEHVVEVFRALRPVLREDATVWCEIGDTYLTHPAGVTDPARRVRASTLTKGRDLSGSIQSGLMDKRQAGLREGNLALIPHRVAIALQEDGWIVRQDHPWSRPNPMPESVPNRATRSHSYIFHIVDNSRYYWDRENAREAQTAGAHSRGSGRSRKPLAPAGSGIRNNESYHAAMNEQPPRESGRNILSVWTIPTQAFPGKHYATFPEEIPRRCIAISTSDRGCCPECGAPFERVTTLGQPDRDWQRSAGGDARGEYDGTSDKTVEGTGAQDPSDVKRRVLAGMVPKITIGWTPRCGCFPDPCDRCGAGWVRRRALRRVSTFNVRVRDAKRGVLAQKSGLGGEAADATDEEVEAYGDEDRATNGETKVVEVDVSWPGCSCRPLVAPVVLDPFAGSGTTLLKARQMYRRSIGIELSPYYVDMMTRRLAEATGGLAPRFVSQRKLTEIAEEA